METPLPNGISVELVVYEITGFTPRERRLYVYDLPVPSVIFIIYAVNDRDTLQHAEEIVSSILLLRTPY